MRDFNKLESTKKFIESCLNYRESRLIEDKISEESSLIGGGISRESRLIKRK